MGKVKISLKPGVSATGATDIRADGRLNSFLGEYDRELDEDTDEPLEFEEQFILRVPKEVEMGRGGEVGLREMIKGKGKGLEGIEFKFLGTSSDDLTCQEGRLHGSQGPHSGKKGCRRLTSRWPTSGVQDQWPYLCLPARGSTQYHRGAKDTRQPTSVQGGGYLANAGSREAGTRRECGPTTHWQPRRIHLAAWHHAAHATCPEAAIPKTSQSASH